MTIGAAQYPLLAEAGMKDHDHPLYAGASNKGYHAPCLPMTILRFGKFLDTHDHTTFRHIRCTCLYSLHLAGLASLPVLAALGQGSSLVYYSLHVTGLAWMYTISCT